jgi:hypothetical protein
VGSAADLVVQTRLRAEPDAARDQDAALRAVVDELFATVRVGVERAEVPDEGSDDPFVRWTLTPDVDATSPDDLAPLAAGAGRLLPELRAGTAVAERGVVVTGDLGTRAAPPAAALTAAPGV